MLYDLIPTDSHKSFYKKAQVYVNEKGYKTLFSYGTPIIVITPGGETLACWDDWSATTGRHIRSFCGLSKAEYSALKKTKYDWSEYFHNL